MPEQKPKKSVQKRIVNISNSILDVLSFLVFLSFFLIGLYAMYDSYKVYENAYDKSLLKYKPGSSQEEAEEDPKLYEFGAHFSYKQLYNILESIRNKQVKL